MSVVVKSRINVKSATGDYENCEVETCLEFHGHDDLNQMRELVEAARELGIDLSVDKIPVLRIASLQQLCGELCLQEFRRQKTKVRRLPDRFFRLG